MKKNHSRKLRRRISPYRTRDSPLVGGRFVCPGNEENTQETSARDSARLRENTTTHPLVPRLFYPMKFIRSSINPTRVRVKNALRGAAHDGAAALVFRRPCARQFSVGSFITRPMRVSA